MSFYTYFHTILVPFILTMSFTLIIGLNRQRLGKAAGLKTHMLVALGVCGITILQRNLYNDMLYLASTNQALAMSIKPENQRVIAQVITGVGFLGAGSILKNNNKIEGLTTAATIWVTAMYSIIFGLGYNYLGITLGVFTMIWIKSGKLSHKHK